MRIDWLEDLVALLDNGGVVEAARARNITQPAFSRRIKALEEVLGFDLIDRSVKPSGPTRALRDHREQVRRVATELRQLLSVMRNEQKTGARQMIIASQHAITTSLGTAIVKSASERSKAHIRLRSANLAECEALLATGQADISLTYRSKEDDAGATPEFLSELVIGEDTLLPVCGAAYARNLMWGFHNGSLKVVSYPADVFLGTILARHVLVHLERTCTLDVVAETALTPAALQLSKSGLGVAWVPEALARPELDQGDMVDLRAELGCVEMELVARRRAVTRHPAVLEFWSSLVDMAGLSRSEERAVLERAPQSLFLHEDR